MNKTHYILFTILIIAVGQVTWVDCDDYHYLPVCDTRCDMSNRMNPFVQGCDDCCRSRGYRKGKCKGLVWSNCLCKPHGAIRQLFNSILNNNQQVPPGYQG